MPIEMLVSLLMHKLGQHQINITPDEIERFFDQNKHFVSVEAFEHPTIKHDKFTSLSLTLLTSEEAELLNQACKSTAN